MPISVHIIFIPFELQSRNYSLPWKPLFHPQMTKPRKFSTNLRTSMKLYPPETFLFHSLKGLEHLTMNDKQISKTIEMCLFLWTRKKNHTKS